MTIEERILDLLIQWEEGASAGRVVDLQQLAGGDSQLARRLQRHIDGLGKVQWLGQEVDGEARIQLPQPSTLRSVMILPDGVQLGALRENLEKSEILSPDVLAAAFQSPHGGNAYRLCAYLLDSELLTRFQLRAIAHGTTRGLILGRYLILDKLGEGGMGQVYRARHRRMERIVALKILPRDLMSQPQAIERFNQEMQVAAQLHHRNIVRAYDADEAEGLHFFVMEYVDGSDLQSVVRSEGPLAPALAIDCVIQASSGLEYAHGVGLVHRDIKPANLLLDRDGTVKILDMGIARLRQPDAEQASLTQEGTVMGTADFMAPEQAISSKSVTPQADIYSLGCTLYYLLTGQPPFAEETLIAKLLAHREKEPPRLSAFRSDIPPALERIYQKCMAKRPMERYLSAAELIADLQRMPPQIDSLPAIRNAASLPVSAAEVDTAPTSLFETLPRLGTSLLAETLEVVPPRRRPILYGAFACVVFALLAAIGWTLLPRGVAPGSLAISVTEDDFVAHLRDHELELIDVDSNQPTNIKLISSQLTEPLPPGRYRIVETTDDGMAADVAEFAIASGERTPIHLQWATAEEKRKIAETLADAATSVPATPIRDETPAMATPAATSPEPTPPPAPVVAAGPGQWKSLFNGEDLTGWTQTAGVKEWFVANGELIGTDATGALISDRHDYQDFRLRMEAYLGDGANSGISVRTATDTVDAKKIAYDGLVLKDSHYEFDLWLPIEPEYYTVGTVHRVAANRKRSYTAYNKARVVQPNRWFQFEIEVIGGKMAVYVDGRKVSEGVDPQPLTAGAIAFCNYFPVKGAAIRYRNIEIQEVNTPSQRHSSDDGASLTDPTSVWIDALTMVKTPDHVVVGNWRRSGSDIREDQIIPFSWFMVPYALKGSYELEMEFTRREGNDAVALRLPIEGGSFDFVFSGYAGSPRGSGLRRVDGRELNGSATLAEQIIHGANVVNGRRHRALVQVDLRASPQVEIAVSFDGQAMFAWSGLVTQLSSHPIFGFPMVQTPGVVQAFSVYEIHALRIKHLDGGQGIRLQDDWGSPFFPVADQPPSEIANECVTGNGHVYYISPNPMNLINAQILAHRVNGRLLTVSSPEELTAIARLAEKKSVWTAGWRPSGHDPWRDERNRPLKFMPEFLPGQPDNSQDREAFLTLEMPGAQNNTGTTPKLNDVMSQVGWPYAVIEWGEE